MLLSTAELQVDRVVPDVTDIATISATQHASACAGVSSWLHVLAKEEVDPPNGRLPFSCFSFFREVILACGIEDSMHDKNAAVANCMLLFLLP